MRCVNCGKQTRFLGNRCSQCGQELSPYVHLPGVLLGMAGAFVGYTFFLVPGALLGGLIGILIYGICFRVFAANR